MQLGILYNWMRDSPGEIDLESPSWRMKRQWDGVSAGYCDMVCQRESGKDSLMDVVFRKRFQALRMENVELVRCGIETYLRSFSAEEL